jgi:hypothetical protein
MSFVVIVRATRKLLRRLGQTPMLDGDLSTTRLGDWYATDLPWRPRQVALFVSEHTLLPLLMPLAPTATLLDRFPDQLGVVLRAHQIPQPIVAAEVALTRTYRVAATANRSLLGSMNEFAHLADTHREAKSHRDLLALSVELATVPCGPLYTRHVSPDRELAVLLLDSAT